ncbi:MAG: aldehyde dehydrogenase family protein [Spirochaetia bacterium]
MLLHERQIEEIVQGVTARIASEVSAEKGIFGKPLQEPKSSCSGSSEGAGIFDTVDEAVAASRKAALECARLSLSDRRRIIGALRNTALGSIEEVSRMAVEETGMGRVEDKIRKNRLAAMKTPGIEALTTEAVSGDDGLMLTERAPYGVICSIIPSTNPTETVINNGISMFAGGNSVIFNPHPGAKKTSIRMIELFSGTVSDNGGPDNVFVSVREPAIESAAALMHHPHVGLLVVTGAEGVVNAAMKSGKKVIGAGPGNPPAVVDETADLKKAAADIVAGASLDNNIICTDEKVTVVVEEAADELVREMVSAGGYRASANQTRLLERLLYPEPPARGIHTQPDRRFIGKDAAVILDAMGVRDPGDPRLILCEVPPDHPFAWSEMLMPVMPVVRMKDADTAIDYAREVEAGRRHTASMHSKNIEKLSRMASVMDCSIFVKNGPNYAGIGFGGEGCTSFTIASPTGEGLTTARSFTRLRRCTLVGAFRIV